MDLSRLVDGFPSRPSSSSASPVSVPRFSLQRSIFTGDAASRQTPSEGSQDGNVSDGSSSTPSPPASEQPSSSSKPQSSRRRDASGRVILICDACGKEFSTKQGLKGHWWTHTGNGERPRPFHCPWDGCGMSFTQSGNMKTHLNTHTGERPYVCGFPGCGRAFGQGTNLRKHESSHAREEEKARAHRGGEARQEREYVFQDGASSRSRASSSRSEGSYWMAANEYHDEDRR